MADRDKNLARIHRVRTVQLNLARAEETRAHDRLAGETALSDRIAALAGAVAPVAQTAQATLLGAAAHYRERLHQSATAAQTRVEAAGRDVDRASEAARAAKRDQSAVEKLRARVQGEALLREIRALEDIPTPKRKTA